MCMTCDDQLKKDVAALLKTIRFNISLAEKFRKEYEERAIKVKTIACLDRSIGDQLELSVAQRGVAVQTAIVEAHSTTIHDIEEIFSDYIENEQEKKAA